MEDLLIGCVGRGSDLSCFHGACNVFDVRNDRGLAVLQSGILLATANVSDMGRNASINDNVIFSGVFINP